MAAGCWSVAQVIGLINQYKTSPAQMVIDGKPLVSTFEGPDWADNWPTVRRQTGDICFIPDWSSLGPHGVGQRLDLIDGACKVDLFPPSSGSGTKGRSFVGCLAQGRAVQDDHGRGRIVHGPSPGEEVHDGRQSLVLYRQVQSRSPPNVVSDRTETRSASVAEELALSQRVSLV